MASVARVARESRVYLSLGSNVDRHQHICAGLDALSEAFGELTLSPVYESEAVGFQGDNFFNLVVGIDTGLSVGQLSQTLKAIEDRNGRRRDCARFSSRTLDIDILTFGQQTGIVDGIRLPRDEILENAFVLLPLVDIAADELHPVAQSTYSQLWEQYDHSAQVLWAVDFNWRGRKLACAANAQ